MGYLNAPAAGELIYGATSIGNGLSTLFFASVLLFGSFVSFEQMRAGNLKDAGMTLFVVLALMAAMYDGARMKGATVQ